MRGLPVRPLAMVLFLLVLWGMAAPGYSPAQETGSSIKFAVYPYKSPKSVIEVFGPIAVRLEEKLGKKVQLVSTPDAATFLEKALAREYDLALPAITVYYKLLPTGYTPIARGVPAFWGGAIVRQDSEIQTIEECRGKKVASMGEHSYAGYLFFKALLDERKIDAKKDLDMQFLGKLDTVIYGVLNKKYDVGVIRLDTLDMKDFVPIKDQFRVVARSPAVPQFPFVVKEGMDERTIAGIREVLTSLSPDRPEDLEILKSLQIKKIVTATKADYDEFYEVIKGSEYFKAP